MIIDSHAHVLLPFERQIALMDEAGVDKTVLFMTSVHPETTTDPASFEREMGKLQEILSGKRNATEARLIAIQEQVEAIARHPDRFIGFGTVPVGLDQAQTNRWIEAQVVANGFRGLGEFTLAPGAVPLLESVFTAAAEFGRLPIWVHTFHPLEATDIRQLVALADRFPQVPVILGHLGGVNWLEAIKLAAERPSLYLDLSAVFTPLAPKLAIQMLPERTLFSSDAPYGDPLLARQLVERVTESSEVRAAVLGGNIARLLGL